MEVEDNLTRHLSYRTALQLRCVKPSDGSRWWCIPTKMMPQTQKPSFVNWLASMKCSKMRSDELNTIKSSSMACLTGANLSSTTDESARWEPLSLSHGGFFLQVFSIWGSLLGMGFTGLLLMDCLFLVSFF